MIFNTTIYKAGEGGGAGTELVVPAIGSVQTAEVNTKVLLVYANEVGGTELQVTNEQYQLSDCDHIRKQISSFAQLTWRADSARRASCVLDENLNATWYIGTSHLPDLDDYDSYAPWDVDKRVWIKAACGNPPIYIRVGFADVDASTFVSKSAEYGRNHFSMYGVTNGFMIFADTGYSNTAVQRVVYNPDTGLYNSAAVPSTAAFFMNYQGSLYLVRPLTNDVEEYDRNTGAVLRTFPISGSIDDTFYDASVGYALSDTGDYFMLWTSVGEYRIYKLNKGGAWSFSKLGVLQGTLPSQTMIVRYRETRDFVHIYVVPMTFTDTTNVRHFTISKETDLITEQGSLLSPEVVDGHTTVLAAAFAPNMSRASFMLWNSSTGDLKCVVSGLDTILPYEYAALPFSSANLADSAVTGFIKSQDGTDELGNPIATVETVLDPNATPPSANRLIGMNVTVNEGEPL